MQAQIQARRTAGGGHDLPFIDVKHLWVHAQLLETSLQNFV